MLRKKAKPHMLELVRGVVAAKARGATHLVVWRSRDGKKCRLQSITAAKPNDVLDVVNAYNKDERVWEVYDLSIGLKKQYAEVRAWHPPKNERKVKVTT